MRRAADHCTSRTSKVPQAKLHCTSEIISLRVINVGDDAKLVKLCEERGLLSVESEFSGSLFLEINESDSTVNLLIGRRSSLKAGIAGV